MDPEAIQALVGCSSRQYQWIERIWRPDPRALRAPERTVARGMEGWQHQFSAATHASNVKHGTLLAIVERMELDEVDSATLDHGMSKKEAQWMTRSQSEVFTVLSLLTKRRCPPVGEELQR